MWLLEVVDVVVVEGGVGGDDDVCGGEGCGVVGGGGLRLKVMMSW